MTALHECRSSGERPPAGTASLSTPNRPLRRSAEVPGGRLSWEQLQRLVALHQQGLGPRRVARELGVGPNTERRYRSALQRAGLFGTIPSEAQLRCALADHLPRQRRPQHRSSLEPWLGTVRSLVHDGKTPQGVFDELARLHGGRPPGSLSAVKRLCLRIYKEDREARMLARARNHA